MITLFVITQTWHLFGSNLVKKGNLTKICCMTIILRTIIDLLGCCNYFNNKICYGTVLGKKKASQTRKQSKPQSLSLLVAFSNTNSIYHTTINTNHANNLGKDDQKNSTERNKRSVFNTSQITRLKYSIPVSIQISYNKIIQVLV